MRIATTLILALLLAGVAVLIYFKGGTADPPVESEQALFPGFVPESVDRIELSMFLGYKAVLEKRASGRWVMTTPVEDEVKSHEVREILEMLSTNRRTLVPLDRSVWDLAGKNLEPAEHYITFRDDSGLHTLYVGSRDAFNSETYVMVEGEDLLFRTGSNIRNILELNPQNLRDDRMFRIDPLLVSELLISKGTGVIMHAAKRGGRWEILEPIRDEGAGIQSLVSRLTSLKLSSHQFQGEVTEEIKARYGLMTEDTIRITLKGGPVSKTVVLGSKGLGPAGDFLCLRDQDQAIVSVSAPKMKQIPLELNRYRSRVFQRPLREMVDHVKIWLDGDLTFELRRMTDSKYFEIVHPFRAPADNVSDGNETPIYTFLTKLDGIKIEDFVTDQAEDLTEYGLAEPVVRAEFVWREGGMVKRAEMRFGNDAGDGLVYAARREKHVIRSVCKVKRKEIEPFFRHPLSLRDRRVFPQDVAAVAAATFTLRDRSFRIARDENDFFVGDPNSRFQVFLNEMTRTQVTRFIPEPVRLEDPRFETIHGSVSIEFKEGEGLRRNVLAEWGERCTGDEPGRYGRISSHTSGIFILGDEFLREFEGLFEGLDG